MLDTILSWTTLHSTEFVVLGIGSIVLLSGTLLATPWFLAKLPEDFFCHIQPAPKQRSIKSISVSVVRTFFGLLLVLLGIVMVITPGPGLVFFVMGVTVSDFPGKHNLIIWLIKQPSIFGSLNWMRRKANKSAFIQPRKHAE